MVDGLRELVITVGCGLVGWALCGVTMEIAMATTTPPRALLTHAMVTQVRDGHCWQPVPPTW